MMSYFCVGCSLRLALQFTMQSRECAKDMLSGLTNCEFLSPTMSVTTLEARINSASLTVLMHYQGHMI